MLYKLIHFLVQGKSVDEIIQELDLRNTMSTPIDYVLCIGHFLESTHSQTFNLSAESKQILFLKKIRKMFNLIRKPFLPFLLYIKVQILAEQQELEIVVSQ